MRQHCNFYVFVQNRIGTISALGVVLSAYRVIGIIKSTTLHTMIYANKKNLDFLIYLDKKFLTRFSQNHIIVYVLAAMAELADAYV